MVSNFDKALENIRNAVDQCAFLYSLNDQDVIDLLDMIKEEYK